MTRTIVGMGFSLCLLACMLSPAMAQMDGPRVYAVTGAKIVVAPGNVIEKGNVIIRDGLISAVGVDAAVPADAKVIEAEEGWTLYSAFIDAATGIGLKAEKQERPSSIGDILAAMSRGGDSEKKGATHELTGIRPENAVVDQLVIDKDAISKHRKLGFGAAQILPRKGIFRGHTAIVTLREADAGSLILAGHYAQTMAFETGNFFSASYPGARIGAVAAVRQALLDGQRLTEWEGRYKENPAMKRPHFQSSTKALANVISGKQPLLFVADARLCHERMARVSKEFGIKPAMILATGEEHFVMDVVKSQGTPLLLPLKFPKKPDWKDDEGLEDISLQTMQAWLNAPRLPGMLESAGVPFAFVTDGMESVSPFMKNLAKVVEAGLPADKALAALTTTPAELLGLDQVLGTLEAGKIANMIIVKGDLFVEKPELRYIFVDGIHEEFEAKKGKGDPNATADPVGTWEVTVEVMGRSSEAVWSIRKEGDGFKGFSESERRGKQDFESVELDGNSLTVAMPSPMGGSFELEVIIDGDKLEGDTDIEVPQMGSSMTIKVKGNRVDKKPKGGL